MPIIPRFDAVKTFENNSPEFFQPNDGTGRIKPNSAMPMIRNPNITTTQSSENERFPFVLE
jgi:hypothetical protein